MDRLAAGDERLTAAKRTGRRALGAESCPAVWSEPSPIRPQHGRKRATVRGDVSDKKERIRVIDVTVADGTFNFEVADGVVCVMSAAVSALEEPHLICAGPQ